MFTIVCLYNQGYQPLIDKTWHKNKVEYCQRHGYKADLRLEAWPNDHAGQVLKVDILEDTLKAMPEDSWTWWTGADLMITNFTIRLEDIIDENYHFIVASDFNGINADSFLLRNSPKGREYLKMIRDTIPSYKDNWEGEQGIMKDTYEKYKHDTVKLVPQKTMNSYNYALYRGRYPEPLIDKLGTVGDWSIGDFVIHWPATGLDFRLQAFDYYSQFILR